VVQIKFAFLNFDKTYFIQFTNKSTCTSDIQITYEDKQISIVNETKFLGLFINNNLFCKTHIECINSKLSTACYAVRSVKPFLTVNTLKMIYYSCFHSAMTYGLLFWGNSPDSIKIFRLQKKIIRIMEGCRYTDSCRKLFINLEILPLPSQYILSLPIFLIRNRSQFLVNSEIHHINTRQHANFHKPSVNVAKYQKGVYYLGVKLFNALPSDIKQSLIIIRNLKWFYKNFYTKNLSIPWMNIWTFRNVKFTFGYTSTNLYYNFFYTT
jgi:hypothetical protein